MKNEFIPYEQSLALKELGFGEKCFGYYYHPAYSKQTILIDSVLDPNHTYFNEFPEKGDFPIIGNYNKQFISAPLYQQAFRWFREKYNLYISLNKYKSPDILIPILVYSHIYDENDNICITVGEFKTYEEAELECLKKLIEICQKKDSI